MSIVHYVLAMRLPGRSYSYYSGYDRYEAPPKKSPSGKLHVATEKLDMAYIMQTISSGADVRTTDVNGDSVLHMVFKRLPNQTEKTQTQVIKVLKYFLEFGLSVEKKNAAGETALFLAIKHRLENVIKFLLRQGARFDSPDHNGNVTLHFMIEHEFDNFSIKCCSLKEDDEKGKAIKPEEGFIRWLLSNTATVDCRNLGGYTPLFVAAKLNLLHVVLMLLKYTKDVSIINKEGKTAFHIVLESIAYFNSYDQLDKGIPTFCYDAKYITDIVRTMLDKGFSIDVVDEDGNTPLLIALANEQTEIVQMMLHHSIKSSDKKDNAILESTDGLSWVQLAVINKNLKALQWLIDNGADFSVLYLGNNLLHLLSASPVETKDSRICDAIVDFLIDEGCDVNARNDDSMTPLHLAVQEGELSIVKRLIEQGANVHSRELSERRLAPLHQAVTYGHENMIEFMVTVGGADVNARTSTGQTPLHLAMMVKHTNMTTTLLRLGAHVDAQDDMGRLALYDAVHFYNVTAVRSLLSYGADINDPQVYQEIDNLPEDRTIMMIMLEHWIKLQAAGMPADDYYRYQAVDRTFQTSYDECLYEADKLKDCLFNDGTSMHELLNMNPNNRCSYVANKGIKDSLLSPKLANLFPMYHIVIQACYHEATARYSLLEPAMCAWYELTGIQLPDTCVDQILGYVDNKTLRAMAYTLNDKSSRDGSPIPVNQVCAKSHC